ncbi:hypothetical protein GCM10027589_13570 [Actinocorallia lasiicapitis]
MRRTILAVVLAMLAALVQAGVQATPSAAGPRPYFYLPFPCGSVIEIKTYYGHSPDDKKADMYRQGMYTGSPILASADGYVHEQFSPGGIEIRHGGGWFTTYMHMSSHVPPGTWVKRGAVVGYMGSVGTSYPHLHYEQLYNPSSDQNAENGHIVNPVIQGEGPLVLNPNNPLTRTSTNCGSGPVKYTVDTFANAPGYSSPGGTRTGTLNAGTNYVYCRVWGPNVQVGSSFNHWWLRTDLDTGSPWQNQYVSAYYLSRWGNDQAKDNSGRDIPTC